MNMACEHLNGKAASSSHQVKPNSNGFVLILVNTRALQVQPVATCRQSPYFHKPAIIIMTSFARLEPTALAVPVLIMTSFSL